MMLSVEVPSHVWQAMAMHDISCEGVKSCLILVGAALASVVSSHVCCCSIEGGAKVARCVVVRDVIDFQILLQRHPVSEKLFAGQVMIVEATLSLYT